jgi:hypothetical protein
MRTKGREHLPNISDNLVSVCDWSHFASCRFIFGYFWLSSVIFSFGSPTQNRLLTRRMRNVPSTHAKPTAEKGVPHANSRQYNEASAVAVFVRVKWDSFRLAGNIH